MFEQYREDRMNQGFVAGLIGVLPEMTYTLTLYQFQIIKLRYLDYAAWMIFHHAPQNWFQTIIAQFIVFIFCGFLGIAFSFAIKKISSRNSRVKGALFGLFNWFCIHAFVTLFQIKGLYPVGFATSVLHLVGGLLWGAIMSMVFSFLNRKYPVKD